MIKELILTDEPVESQGPYRQKFDSFNLVQSTLLRNEVPDADCNLVLGTATSTGKTISSEFFVYTTLAKKKMVIYAAPMRALATEKYEEWVDRFPNHNVQIITGDFKENNKEEKIVHADIIILTNEMLDVKTRGLRDEDHWLRRVGLLIVDEAHIMGSEQRGAAAEAGIIRLTQFVKEARIVLLSATVPNYMDFVKWLHALNQKDTYYLNTSWRPVPLEWRYIPIRNSRTYADRIESTVNQCVEIVQNCLPEKCLCFVHEKKTGELLLQRFKKLGIPAAFHSADKSAADRKKFETSFADRSHESMKVLVSTSTLAWGVSLPARNVVVCGTKRGISPVEVADVIQMAGRSGRLGIDDRGTCHLLSDEVDKWKMLVSRQAPVLSQLSDSSSLSFQLLAEVYLRVIKTIEDLSTWYNRTLTSIQESNAERLFLSSVSKLKKYGMLVANENEELFTTPLGQLSTRSYFRPDDVFHWKQYLEKLATKTQPLNEFNLAILIGMSPSIGLDYVPRQYQGNVDGFIGKCRQNNIDTSVTNGCSFFIAYCIYEQLIGEASAKGLSFHVQNIVNDAERICGTITGLVKLLELDINTDSILARLKYGVPEQMADLCSVPGVGAKRAFLLWGNSIKSREDLLNAGREKVSKIVGPLIARKIFEELSA